MAKQQYLAYFVLEVLVGSKKYYSEVEKICYAVVMSARNLQHYLKSHTIIVLTNQSLHDLFGNRDSSKRIGKWAIELSEYIVDFKKLLTVIKCIYLPSTYLHFIQDIEDRCLLLMSSMSFIDLPFQEHRMLEKHHIGQNPCIYSLCPK
jgi:hypothetical protein